MKDKALKNSTYALLKRRRSIAKRKRMISEKNKGGKGSLEPNLNTSQEDEETNRIDYKSADESPKMKKRKESTSETCESIKSEDTASQDEAVNIDEALLFEVEKTEVFKSPTKELKALFNNMEEQDEFPKLICSPFVTPVTKENVVKSESFTMKSEAQTPNRTTRSHRQTQAIGGKYTPNTRERKLSLASDYDQLSDTVKSELYNATNFNELEPIEMVHDLDTVMHFEGIEVNERSPMLAHNTRTTNKEAIDDTESEHCDDPSEDPLYIPETDEKKKSNRTLEQPRKAKYVTKKIQAIKYIKLGKPSKKSLSLNQKKRICLKPKKQKVNNELCSDVEEALEDIEIKLMHDVPPQHLIESSAGSTNLSLKEKRVFESYGPLRKGVFSPNEDEIIKQNWKSFCELHDWEPEIVQPFLYMRHGSKYYMKSLTKRQKFVQFLANGLPWRTLYSVYQRFRKLYGNQNKVSSRYTEEEDKKILSYIEENDDENSVNKFADLAKLLRRSRKSIWMRYHRLQKLNGSESEPSTVVWSKTIIAKFIQHLIDVTLSENVRELKDATIPKPVWLKLEDKLKIDHDILKTFWMSQLHMQLFCPNTIYLNDVKIQLIEYIHGKGISNTREIIWPNVAKYFEGFTSVFLCKIFFHLVREVTVKKPKLEFVEIIEDLYQKKIPEIREELTDKYLPRLKYENERVEFIAEQTDEHIDIEQY